jgi:hypothetical protein
MQRRGCSGASKKGSIVVTKRVLSWAIKPGRAGVGVKFRTSKGKKIAFVGHKTAKKPVRVEFRAKRK